MRERQLWRDRADFKRSIRSSALGVGIATLFAGAAVHLPAVHAALPLSDGTTETFIGVRVLKTNGFPNIPWSVSLPATCRGCRLVLNDRTSGQDPGAFFFHLWMPQDASTRSLRVLADPRAVRAVLVSRTDVDLPKRGFEPLAQRAVGMTRVPFMRNADGIAVSVPARLTGTSLPPDDLADVTEKYTFIETPAVYVRISHADPAGRRGAYASGVWPEVQAKASLNLEFAARQAIETLHLGRYVQQRGVETIMLMNFDTNYPTLGPDSAHDDWPPHWHMHLFWKTAPRVRKVGHFYITAQGLLAEHSSSDRKSLFTPERIVQWHRQGEADETRTPDGQLLFSHMITRDGHFRLRSPLGTCDFHPIAGGFDSGVRLVCDGSRETMLVRAEDDIVSGQIRLILNGRLVQTYRYDGDTGALLIAAIHPAKKPVLMTPAIVQRATHSQRGDRAAAGAR